MGAPPRGFKWCHCGEASCDGAPTRSGNHYTVNKYGVVVGDHVVQDVTKFQKKMTDAS